MRKKIERKELHNTLPREEQLSARRHLQRTRVPTRPLRPTPRKSRHNQVINRDRV